MKVVLYRNISGKNVVNKQITQLGEFNGNLRDECSINQPVISLAGAIPPLANYAFIPEFQRYYFVELRSIRTGIFQMSGRTDVVKTFIPSMGDSSVIVNRNANVYSTYLDDNSFKTDSRPQILTKLFPYSFDTYQLILTVAGSD